MSAGETAKGIPLQVTVLIALINGSGYTVTNKVKGLFCPQSVVVGVTI